MTDFIQYVVAELKSKRLSRADAQSLLRQFACRGRDSGEGSVIHPLLHTNTSDLQRQRYTTKLTGEESFLADHRIRQSGESDRKILAGVAYLEMVRAAVEAAVGNWP